MSVVNILKIQVLDNPTSFTNPFQFEITFECTSSLKDDLEWKIVYVGSAEDEQYDQVLDCILVGPVPIGINKFVYQANAPDPKLIPSTDVTGVTVVLLTCSYKEQEFVRVGYYVNNEYDDENLRIEPPTLPLIHRLTRNILADKPRVTRFPIKWDIIDELEPPSTPLTSQLELGESNMQVDDETIDLSNKPNHPIMEQEEEYQNELKSFNQNLKGPQEQTFKLEYNNDNSKQSPFSSNTTFSPVENAETFPLADSKSNPSPSRDPSQVPNSSSPFPFPQSPLPSMTTFL